MNESIFPSMTIWPNLQPEPWSRVVASITYLRQSDVPTILDYLENAGLNYYWIPSIKLKAHSLEPTDKHIVIKQKTLSWLFKGNKIRKPRPDVDDLVESKTPSEGKKFDRWAQSPVELNITYYD